jgi:hypothetical protein
VHFGLTTADRRILMQPEPALDRKARAGLLESVMHQSRHPDSDAVQYAVVHMSPDMSPDHDNTAATVVFVSDQVALASVSPSVEARLP